MADPTTPTADDRIARLEARVAELERRLDPPPGLYRTPGGGTRIVLSPEERAAQEAEYRKWVDGLPPPGPIEELHRMQLESGADPNGTWAREEIERMREE